MMTATVLVVVYKYIQKGNKINENIKRKLQSNLNRKYSYKKINQHIYNMKYLLGYI